MTRGEGERAADLPAVFRFFSAEEIDVDVDADRVVLFAEGPADPCSVSTFVKEYTLAFVTDGGGCTPKWAGVTDLGSDGVASRIGELRAKGGDVRVSFGGASGAEPATTCSSADGLATAYGKVVDGFKLTKVDFDVEGGALPNTAANTRRAQAIARLQQQHPASMSPSRSPSCPRG